MASLAQESQTKPVRGSRSRSGCLNCRARRKKCDEVRPSCSRCQTSNEKCTWDEKFPFRSTGISAQHPSMLQSRNNQRPELQIVDISFNSGRKQRQTRRSRISSQRSDGETGTLPAHRGRDSSSGHDHTGLHISGAPSQSQTTSRLPTATTPGTSSPPPSVSLEVPQRLNSSPFSNETTTRNGSRPSTGIEMERYGDIDLGTLDYLTSHVSNIDTLTSALHMAGVSTWSPKTDLVMLEAVRVPDEDVSQVSSVYHSTFRYRELQSTLQDSIVETARSTATKRQGSVELRARSQREDFVRPQGSNSMLSDGSQTSVSQGNPIQRVPTRGLVTPRRQLELWTNYLDEIAPWLDMFDLDCHFQTTVPLMARSAPHLHYTILSISARQMERRSPEVGLTESLILYQEAVKLIMPRLQGLETDIIVSCVLLCVLEMMSCSAKAWARHLDGCAMLMEAAGINGAVGGVQQAIFWCFARMDMWGGYLGDTVTRIPMNRWFVNSASMATAVDWFKHESSADTYANYAVFLTASAVNIVSAQEADDGGEWRHSRDPTLYGTRWKALYDLLEDWYTGRPEIFIPLMNEKPDIDDSHNPFPIVLYATSHGVAGNQMYHAASLLMLRHKPKELRSFKSRKSILWHARKICGIAASNADHSAWINALQPIWMAGKVMSHASEHIAILDILQRIENETGFATQWRCNDLKEYWGDCND